jgi:hypothetical protein
MLDMSNLPSVSEITALRRVWVRKKALESLAWQEPDASTRTARWPHFPPVWPEQTGQK